MGYEIKDGKIHHNGQRIHILGVNVMGMELPQGVIFGPGWGEISIFDYLKGVRNMGFNAVRLPITHSTIHSTSTDPGMISKEVAHKGEPAMVICDYVITCLEQLGLRYVLDYHYYEGGIPDLWYTDKLPEWQWLEDLQLLARRYKGREGFMGIDTKNEPNSNTAKWGSGGEKIDWKIAAEKAYNNIRAENPDILVITEWLGTLPGLSEMLENPMNVDLRYSSLSPHIYGPDVWSGDGWQGEGFESPEFPKNMPKVWNRMLSTQKYHVPQHIIIGEWGGNFGRGRGGMRDVAWQATFAKYLKDNDIDSFYWLYSNDSDDTGGMLEKDWKTWRQDKVEMIRLMRTPYTTYLGEKPRVDEPKPDPKPDTIIPNQGNSDNRSDVLAVLNHLFGSIAKIILENGQDSEHLKQATETLIEAKDAAVRACL